MEEISQIIEDCKSKGNYIATPAIAIAIFLAGKLEKPILIEGMPGVGKTELAKVVAKIFNWQLIRLQCYEGIDETHILYEWAYAKQLLFAEILKGKINSILANQKTLKTAFKKFKEQENIFFSMDFLECRPLLKALMSTERVVLLIDEIDRADRETEAFLLEALSDFQVSIPEIGTIRAQNKPFVILTSNDTRELSDALKRRCIYLYIDFPSPEQELEIIRLKVPSIQEKLAKEIVDFIQKLRTHNWKKIPSVSETIDWAMALMALNVDSLDEEIILNTINILLKHKSDFKNCTNALIQAIIKSQEDQPLTKSATDVSTKYGANYGDYY